MHQQRARSRDPHLIQVAHERAPATGLEKMAHMIGPDSGVSSDLAQSFDRREMSLDEFLGAANANFRRRFPGRTLERLRHQSQEDGRRLVVKR